MRLIDADKVVTIQVYDDMTEEYGTKKVTIADAIDEWSDEGCPETIDAEPIKHGRWIWSEDASLEEGQIEGDRESFYQCSECGAYDLRLKDCHADYCWSCGAKMDEDEVEE